MEDLIGGGAYRDTSVSKCSGGAGGGGTDIRINNTSLYARVIVARRRTVGAEVKVIVRQSLGLRLVVMEAVLQDKVYYIQLMDKDIAVIQEQPQLEV